jgi:hypothetical protein
MASNITASVGRKGKNKPDDVKIVQNLLNGFASRLGFSKLKVDGNCTRPLEQAIGTFQEEICGTRPDCRIDPGRATMKKLAAGPAKAEAERKAQIKQMVKFIDQERVRMRAQIRKLADKIATGGGLPQKAANKIFDGAETLFTDQYEAMVGLYDDLSKADQKDITQKANIVLKAAEERLKTVGGQVIRQQQEVITAITSERNKVLKGIAAFAQKQASSNGLPAKVAEKIAGELEAEVMQRFDSLVDLGEDLHDATPKVITDVAGQVLKSGEAGVKAVASELLNRRKQVLKTIAAERNKMMAQVKKEAEKHAKRLGLPVKAGEMFFDGVESFVTERYDALADLGDDLLDTEPGDVTKIAEKVLKEAAGQVNTLASEVSKQQANVLKMVQKAAQKQAKILGLAGKGADKVLGEMESFANDQWDWFMGKQKSGAADSKDIAKMADEVAKGAGAHISTLLEDAAARDGESDPDAKTPLLLKGAEEGIKQGAFSFKVSGVSPDPKAKVLLIVGKPGLQLDMTKGFDKSKMVELFKLIDQGNLWSSPIDFYAVETTNGKPDPATKSKTVTLRAPVAPFKGTVSFAGLGADKGMTYTGNGTGRYLYTTPINGWYFLKYGPNFEREPKMRGFDCITYVGSAKKTMTGMDGRGDKLAAKLGATKVDLEGVAKEKIVEYFGADGKSGNYIAWWKTHCIAVVGGTVHEFSQSKGGFKATKATSYGWPKTGNYVRKL